MKKLTKEDMEAIKKSMEEGVNIAAHLKEKGITVERGGIQEIVAQMRDSFGDEEFKQMRMAIQSHRKSENPERRAERLHKAYTGLIGSIDTAELADSCISDIQELLVLCEVRKTEFNGPKG